MNRALLVLGLLSAGCGRSQLNQGSPGSLDTRSSAPAADADLAPDPALSAEPRPLGSAGVTSTRGNAEAGSFAPPEVADQPSAEAWVGELWTNTATLCDPDDRDDEQRSSMHRTVTYRVVLLLDPRAPVDAPTGHIHFGEGGLPKAPPPQTDGYAEQDWFWLCARERVTKGGEYTVLAARRTATRLTFRIIPAEIWRPFCSNAPVNPACWDRLVCPLFSDCPCDESGCHLDRAHTFSFDLRIQDDTMEGLFPESVGAELRLRRVQ